MKDWYVVWHGTSGAHGLHGPFEVPQANAAVTKLLREMPDCGATVVRLTPLWFPEGTDLEEAP